MEDTGRIVTDLKNFTIVHNEFIDTQILTGYEKLVFLAIKRHLNSENLQAFPSTQTICKHTGFSKPTVIKAIKGLKDKEILTVRHRSSKSNGNISNLYTLIDRKELWTIDNPDNFREMAKTAQYEWAKQIIEEAGGKVIEKEKSLKSATDQSTDLRPNSNKSNNQDNKYYKYNEKESQAAERCTLDELKDFIGYEVLLDRMPDSQKDIDGIFNLLYDVLNSTKPTIRISGEERPADVVKGRLEKLNYEHIEYVIRKYNEQTGRIHNPTAYKLKLLYDAVDQMNSDIQNHIMNTFYGNKEADSDSSNDDPTFLNSG